jgi:hypothetical protein
VSREGEAGKGLPEAAVVLLHNGPMLDPAGAAMCCTQYNTVCVVLSASVNRTCTSEQLQGG